MKLDPSRARAFVRRVPWLEVAILALSFGVLVALALANIRENEQAVSQLDSYSSYDAKSGGYRAWADLLTREGVAVDRFEMRPAFLDKSIGTLVYAEPLDFDPRQEEQTRVDVRQLDAWIRAGGRLLYLGHDDTAADEKLLALPHSTAAKKKAPKKGAHAKPAPPPPKIVAPRPVIAPELAAFGVAHIESRGILRFVPDTGTRVLLGDRAGAIVVRYSLGRGNVTSVIDESIFTNGRLALADHARLAYALLATPGTGRVAFDEAVHGYEAPLNWWDLVPRALVVSFVLGVAAIAIAIVGGAIRFGPPIVPPIRDDRASGEFIDSVAALYLRGKAVRKALLDAWTSTKRAAAARAGLPDDAPLQDIAARVEGSDVQSDLIALERIATNAFPDETNLVRGMALAQRLRKEFATHGRTGR